MSVPTLKQILEGLLFVAERPLSLSDLARLLTEHDRNAIQAALRILQAEYDDQQRAFALREVAGGYRLQTRERLRDWILRLRRISPQRLSRAALETLALVAYRQPVTRAEIEEVRGVDVSATLRLLLDRRLIRIAGRKGVPGRPLLYGTTRHFLEMFELKDLSALPALEELEQLEQPDGSQTQLPLFRQGPCS